MRAFILAKGVYMRRLSVLWLWILAGLSGVFVLCALALYGIHHYAKSHSYEATIEATFTSATASPPHMPAHKLGPISIALSSVSQAIYFAIKEISHFLQIYLHSSYSMHPIRS